MSYFVFGKIHYRGGMSELERTNASWQAVRAGQDLDLSVALSCNIVQQNVHEMLRAQTEDVPSDIAFFLTGSPLEDTSDSLISPFQITPEAIQANVAKLDRWICEIASQENTLKVSLFLTEGYDNWFETVCAKPSDFMSTLQRYWDLADEIPSLRVTIAHL